MKTIVTLSKWLIQNTNTETYRAGRLSGWKHPKVNKSMIDAVGGMKMLLEQAKTLEKDASLRNFGQFLPQWRDMGSDIKSISYEISIIPELCHREGIEDAREHQIKLLERVEKWKKQIEGQTWILPFYEELLKSLTEGKITADAEDELLFQCLNTLVLLKQDIWERAFSSIVFHDSKKFAKSYKDRIFTILTKYSPYYEEEIGKDELFSMHKIHSYAQTLEWKGSMQYLIDAHFLVDSSMNPYGVVLNSQTLEHSIPYSLSGVKKIMTIENKANYENMTYAKDTIYIFCHGYFTPKEVRFLRKMYELAEEDCEFLHWGDLDYGGINIFLFNKESVFPKLIPYKMDVAHFKKALEMGAGIPLEKSKREKLEKKDAKILQELKDIILETNLVIEQECFIESDMQIL